MIPRSKSVALVRRDETSRVSQINKSTKIPTNISFPTFDPSKPSPYQFEKFFPWVCTQWCASTIVIVTRVIQEKYVKYENRKPMKSARKNKSVNIQLQQQQAYSDLSAEDTTTYTRSSKSVQEIFKGGPMLADRVIPIVAYYDEKQNLVEIKFLRSSIIVSRRVIHALSLCIPYYPMLNRLTFRKGGLTDIIIYEISKLLPLSTITELCFDDSYVPQINYYIFLEQSSQLKYLSLNQCRINDDACKKLFNHLDLNGPSANSLQVIELGSNEITDEGAIFIGNVLKTNRCLLHINLSGNKITDDGFSIILGALMEFPLTPGEHMAMKRRRLRFLLDKRAVYERCLNDIKYGQSDDVYSISSKKSVNLKKMRKKGKKHITDQSLLDVADMMSQRVTGEFADPYSSEHVVCRDGIPYSKGNLTLCSVNMAYNNLTLVSVVKLIKVLAYQHSLEKLPNETGLMRITFDGNYMPSSCVELDDVDVYLKTAIASRQPLPRRPMSSSFLKKSLSAKQSNT